MPEHTDPLRFPLQHHLDAHTTSAGWHIGPDALDPTDPRLGSLVTTLIEATARSAAATHLWHLLDAPLSFLLEVIGDGPIDNHEGDLLQLLTLLQLRGRMREQREEAAADVSDACEALHAVGMTTPVTADITWHSGGQADRRTAVLAALVDAEFLAELTEHRAARRYQAVVAGDTVHADLAVDGSFTLHSTGHDGSPPWHITASGSTPARFLAALIRACTTPDADPRIPASTPAHPGDGPTAASTHTAEQTETTGEHPHGHLGL
ncbi:hypothetical protein Dvina_51530 [Dactylosporangium vinaceum]|uniref:Uncharacterized protein n=1 Tax=Dactylosporangium vinaceum TaxID=53362 RepID=A0ABV5M2I4_9ACTN|nr:hypothetical protein [Dactylosporangium vinaceum]UAB96279.1 hypothetical protein Dvina_51530 [Dactylosporangium vinaceum]